MLLEPETLKRKTKVVANSRAGIDALLMWCRKQDIGAAALHALLEGTGVYHEEAAYALHEAGVRVSIVNPARARDFARGLGVLTKTDGVDALVSARFGVLKNRTPYRSDFSTNRLTGQTVSTHSFPGGGLSAGGLPSAPPSPNS